MTDSTDRLSLPHILPGQAQKEVWHNEALAIIDAVLHPLAESRGLDVPPTAPQPGQCWIAGSAPTGDWSGKADRLAIFTSAGWRFVEPHEGMMVWLRDQQVFARYAPSGWEDGQVSATAFSIGGVQVIGAQEPQIADISGGATVDSEARSAIADILSAMRNHGIIAT